MIYNEFKGLKLPALGFGAMRLPIINGEFKNVDEAATAEMVDYAMANGVNYFDTAWGYHDGMSETTLGKCLSKYPRESYFLADKFPGYDLSLMDKVEEIFEEQLKRCQVEYFDFYFFHNLCELNVEQYLDPKYRIYDYLMEQKKNGRIKHLGFSAHAGQEAFDKFLDAYGDDMEFCQLQLNYIDWEFQDARKKVEQLKKLGIPVWVMEPVRGGSLVKLEDDYEKVLKGFRPDAKIVEWAFRFLQSIPDVTITLSGMSNMDQIKENIQTYAEFKPLNEEEMSAILKIADEKVKKIALPCTSCRYCTSHCPKGIDIPEMLNLYNEHCFTGGGFIAPMAMGAIPEDKQPGACIDCGNCESVCPQKINISDAMADFAKKMEESDF